MSPKKRKSSIFFEISPKNTKKENNSDTDFLLQEKDREFNRKFNLENEQMIINEWKCSYCKKKRRTTGVMILSQNYMCFSAKTSISLNMKKVFPLRTIAEMTVKENVVEIITNRDKKRELVFESGLENISGLIFEVWKMNQIGKAISSKDFFKLKVEKDEIAKLESLEEVESEMLSPSEKTEQLASEERKILTEKDWEILIGGKKSKTFAQDQVILHQDDLSQKLIQITAGRCKLETMKTDGTKISVATATVGELLGILSFTLPNQLGLASFVAIEDVSVTIIEGSYLKVAFQQDPFFEARFYRYLAAQLVRRVSMGERVYYRY
eukprot:TRINITY_DN2237_c0_g1_i3.p1 TRINITY_DN2237_c0_g1~~TRINITY_DN2237_c0_g1_i3.p1  ORF type:complete len:340 (-),score=76.56 TRINITY_DN2237_c0_g1_i3:51-1022(-)